MFSLTRHIFATALLLGVLGTLSDVWSQSPAVSKERTGSVSGRVTISGKGAAGLTVSLYRSRTSFGGDPPFRDVTDQEGHYRISGVPAGNYSLAPFTPGFVSDGGVPYAVMLGEGEAVEGIDFELRRGGVITGKVSDAEGNPLVEHSVHVISPSLNIQHLTGPSHQEFQTDDRGIYRVFGVPPGRYLVSVGRGPDDTFMDLVGRVAYPQTFHPNVTDAAKATVVEIAEGTEATGVDITVGRALRGFAASGRVVDGATGHPVANVNLRLTREVIREDLQSSRSSDIPLSQSRGEFHLENLTPGKYSISVAGGSGSDMLSNSVEFDIQDSDVNGILIETSQGASVSGFVILEPSHEVSTPEGYDQLYVAANISGPGHRRFGAASSIQPNGEFRLSGLRACSLRLWIGRFAGNNQGYSISRIERNGQVINEELQIEDGEKITGLKIFATSPGTGRLRGQITVENGAVTPGAHFSVNLTSPGGQFPISAQAQVDSRGRFVIENLRGGSYELTAFVYLPGSRSSAQAKKLVNVAEGSPTDVTVVIDLKQNPASLPRQ